MSDMYIYDNNNSNESRFEDQYPVSELSGHNSCGSNGRKPGRKPNEKMKSLVRRAGAIALSAVLFGTVAAGTFQSINYLNGSRAVDAAAAEGQTEKTGQNLLKTTSSTTVNKGSLDVTDIVKSAMPSIVAITSQSVREVEDYFGMFQGRGYVQQEEVENCGSGIIIGKNDSELLVVTNNHVVEGADTLSVCFADDKAYEAVVKGTDSSKDLAVVAVPLDSISKDTMSQIAVAVMGDSSELEVGEQVVAIGNALGYGQSVTTGIVSAVNRTLNGEEGGEASYDGISLIQTDAAINPGNSGGALLNMDGEVVGINSAKLASTEVEGMGYAISINGAYDTIESLMNEETRTKAADGEQASIGIMGTGVSDEASEIYGIPSGVYVSEVTEGGAAEQAGITANSVITAFDGKAVSGISELKEMLEYYKAGETVEVTVQVPDGNGYTETTRTLTLGRADTAGTTQSQETEGGSLSDYNGGFTGRQRSSSDPT